MTSQSHPTASRSDYSRISEDSAEVWHQCRVCEVSGFYYRHGPTMEDASVVLHSPSDDGAHDSFSIPDEMTTDAEAIAWMLSLLEIGEHRCEIEAYDADSGEVSYHHPTDQSIA